MLWDSVHKKNAIKVSLNYPTGNVFQTLNSSWRLAIVCHRGFKELYPLPPFSENKVILIKWKMWRAWIRMKMRCQQIIKNIILSYKFQTRLHQPRHYDTIISGMWWRDSTARPTTTLTDSTPRNVYKVEECKAVLTIAFLECNLRQGYKSGYALV